MEAIVGIFILIFFLLITLIIKGIRIIREGEVGIVEHLGKYRETLNPGFHIINIAQDRVLIVNMKELTLDIPPQNVVTKDSITIGIDSFVSYRIIDPQKAVYAVEDLRRSIQFMVQTTIRNYFSEIEFKDVYVSRKAANSYLFETMNEIAKPWGIKILNIEIKDIAVPRDLKEKIEQDYLNR